MEEDIENVNNVLKITQIRAAYHLKVSKGKTGEAQEVFSVYLNFCPAAQGVIGCINSRDNINIEEVSE